MTTATLNNATIHLDLELIRVWTQYLAVAHGDRELLSAASVIWSGVHDVDSLPDDVRGEIHELAAAFDGREPDATKTPEENLAPGTVERILLVTGDLRQYLEIDGTAATDG